MAAWKWSGRSFGLPRLAALHRLREYPPRSSELATVSYSLKTLWYERQRFLPGVLAVAFSALLITVQTGLLLGLFAITSIPIDRTRADVWVTAPDVLSVDLGKQMPASRLNRVIGDDAVE